MGILANEREKDHIVRQIEAIRLRMMELGDIYGLDDQRVLQASRELDALIVSFYRKLGKA